LLKSKGGHVQMIPAEEAIADPSGLQKPGSDEDYQ